MAKSTPALSDEWHRTGDQSAAQPTAAARGVCTSATMATHIATKATSSQRYGSINSADCSTDVLMKNSTARKLQKTQESFSMRVASLERSLRRARYLVEVRCAKPSAACKSRDADIGAALKGSRAFGHYLTCYQLVLWKQTHWLIKERAFPEQLEVRLLFSIRDSKHAGTQTLTLLPIGRCQRPVDFKAQNLRRPAKS